MFIRGWSIYLTREGVRFHRSIQRAKSKKLDLLSFQLASDENPFRLPNTHTHSHIDSLIVTIIQLISLSVSRFTLILSFPLSLGNFT